MKKIPLYSWYPELQGKFALVDDADHAEWSHLNWTISNGYAVCTMSGKTVAMHRLLAGARPKEIVDHINQDILDNQRHNLRICTPSESMQNRDKGRTGPTNSRFTGVFLTKSGRFRAGIGHNKKFIHLGVHPTERAAAEAYNAAALRIYGENAHLNLF